MKRLRLLAAAAAGLLIAGSDVGAARADPADDAAAALRNSSLYRGAPAPKIDAAQVSGSRFDRIKLAILPTGGPDPVTVARDLGRRLDPEGKGLTVLVFEGTAYGSASTDRCGVGRAIDDAVSQHLSDLRSTDDVTATVLDFAAAVRSAPSAADGCGSGSSDVVKPDDKGAEDSGGSGVSAATVLLVLVALVAGGIGFFAWSRRRRRNRELSDARAGGTPYYDRLAAEVNGIDPKDDPVARQAMADAAERFNSAGGQLGTADSVEKYAQARRTTLEGLYAARTARRSLGLDPGPDLPPVAEGAGQQLDRPREINVQGQTYQGYPAYAPGAPYYYGGGYGVPGGWYSFPFWETLLVGSVLAGGLGGWGMGGYGMGYDNGYLTGYEAGENADSGGSDPGGDSGWGDSGGGGDWADSSWGDSGGGGGWGGGGGFGGGGSGGGGGGGGAAGRASPPPGGGGGGPPGGRPAPPGR